MDGVNLCFGGAKRPIVESNANMLVPLELREFHVSVGTLSRLRSLPQGIGEGGGNLLERSRPKIAFSCQVRKDVGHQDLLIRGRQLANFERKVSSLSGPRAVRERTKLANTRQQRLLGRCEWCPLPAPLR